MSKEDASQALIKRNHVDERRVRRGITEEAVSHLNTGWSSNLLIEPYRNLVTLFEVFPVGGSYGILRRKIQICTNYFYRMGVKETLSLSV